MEATANKESRLNIRCNTHARALLDRAAAYAHLSVSEFVLSHALASAEKVVQQQEAITLKPEDFVAFRPCSMRPPHPMPPCKRRCSSMTRGLCCEPGAHQRAGSIR